VDWSKVDAALAGALEGAGDRRLAVFVQVFTGQAGQAVLAEWRLDPGGPAGPAGPGGPTGTAGLATATAVLSAEEVAELTDQPWVARIQLSQRLRPLDQPGET
jgi:hypothetical protein